VIDARAPEGTPPEVREVRLVINELSPKCVSLFGTAALNPGQEVVLELQDPAAISLPAKVLWCQRDTSSHIISTDPHAFRILLEFKLGSSEEQQAVKTFCDDVAKNQIFTHKVA